MDIVTLAERPEFADAIWELSDLWPPFMLEDPSGDLYYSSVAERWADWTLLAIDGDRLVARGHCITFALGDDIGRPDLPDSGWDGVIHMAYLDSLRGREPNTVGALEILIHPDARGTGLAGGLIAAMRDMAGDRGFGRVVIPVRPSAKHLEPLTSIEEYAWRTRADGLPHDPWLRTHVRAGGRILQVCPTAMTIPGTLDEWREWTGLPFDTSGPQLVEGALNPVHVDIDNNHAVYVEPNVWVEHLTDVRQQTTDDRR